MDLHGTVTGDTIPAARKFVFPLHSLLRGTVTGDTIPTVRKFMFPLPSLLRGADIYEGQGPHSAPIFPLANLVSLQLKNSS